MVEYSLNENEERDIIFQCDGGFKLQASSQPMYREIVRWYTYNIILLSSLSCYHESAA